MTIGSRAGAVVAIGAAALGLAACSSSTPSASSSAPTDLSGSITVFAAASLTESFTELAAEFEAKHQGTTVELNFAGSSDLATQIIEGAPANVFASADERNMAKVTDAAFADGAPVKFATNSLEIAVPPGNPASITSFADLARAGTKTVICAPQVPCGAATVAAEDAAGISLTPVSEESSVTDALGKVLSGEADAGVVYVTDVLAAGDAVVGIEFDESSAAVTTYPIAVLDDTSADESTTRIAGAFVAYVTSDAGQRILRSAGFGSP